MWGRNGTLIQKENDKLERGRVNELNKREKGHSYHMPTGFHSALSGLFCIGYFAPPTHSRKHKHLHRGHFALHPARLNSAMRIQLFSARHYMVRSLCEQGHRFQIYS